MMNNALTMLIMLIMFTMFPGHGFHVVNMAKMSIMVIMAKIMEMTSWCTNANNFSQFFDQLVLLLFGLNADYEESIFFNSDKDH